MTLYCAIYTRKSSEEGLEQGFNSLDAQREACEAFILSQKSQGWKALKVAYDDGGFSGGNTERPGLQRLMDDIRSRRVNIVVVYKVDRLTRSLADFAKLVELFDEHGVSFVSVTQQFNTTTSMGRLTLNVLLSFAQFEREVTGERIRDKIALSKRKGLWMGGLVPMGYQSAGRTLVPDEVQADTVREIFQLYLRLGTVRLLKAELDRRSWRTPPRNSKRPGGGGDRPFQAGHLYKLLSNPIYRGQIRHRGEVYPGEHPAIIDEPLWEAVQSRLAENGRADRTRSNAAVPSLLAGLVFDAEGNRLTPTHAQKGTRRYRYYIGPPGIKPLRLPAQELEAAVLQALRQGLTDERRWLVLHETEAFELVSVMQRGQELAVTLAEGRPASQIELLQQALERVVVEADQIRLRVKVQALGAPSHLRLDIDFPVTLKRCGMAMRLIVPGPGIARRPDPKLVGMLAKAQDWFQRIVHGQTQGGIAEVEGVTTSYVTRVLYLAFLAPGIVQAISKGEHPPTLSLERLMRSLPLPLEWAEQRRVIGFTQD